MSCKKKSGNTDYKDRYDGRGLRLEKNWQTWQLRTLR